VRVFILRIWEKVCLNIYGLVREVEYKTDGMFMEDGLYYYMKLFGLDAFEDQKIRLNKRRNNESFVLQDK
jgi:hypothetical protein